MGVPRDHFVVLGADRLWSNALPRAGDPPSERQGRQVKIAVHDSLPLAVAAAGIATLGPEQDTVEHIRQLIATTRCLAPQLRRDRRAPPHGPPGAAPGDPGAREARAGQEPRRCRGKDPAEGGASHAARGLCRLGASNPRHARARRSMDRKAGRAASRGGGVARRPRRLLRSRAVRGRHRDVQAFDPGADEARRARPPRDRGGHSRGRAALPERRIATSAGPVDVVLIDARGARCVPVVLASMTAVARRRSRGPVIRRDGDRAAGAPAARTGRLGMAPRPDRPSRGSGSRR